MRNFNAIIRTFLGAAAFTTFAACEEVDPPKVDKPVVRTVEPSTPPPPVAQKVDKIDKVEVVPAPKPTVDVTDEDSTKDPLAGARDALTSGELDRAMKLAKLAVKKQPTKSSSWNTLGRAQLKSGQRKEAIASFEKAVELNPRSPWANNNLGLALLYDGKFEEAADALEEATASDKAEGYMWNNLGMAYEHLDRLEEARSAYQKAVAQKVGNAEKNLARLQGVASIRTAKADVVKSDVTPSGGNIDLSTLDGGVDGNADAK